MIKVLYFFVATGKTILKTTMFYSCSCSALLQLDLLMEMKGYTPPHNYVYIVLLGKAKKGKYGICFMKICEIWDE